MSTFEERRARRLHILEELARRRNAPWPPSEVVAVVSDAMCGQSGSPAGRDGAVNQVARALAISALVALAGCDAPAGGADAGATSARPAVTAPGASAPAATATSAASAAPSASASPRKEVVCSKESKITFPDPALEAAVRLKLQKPDGDIQRADLKKVRSLNLSEAKQNDALDPCLMPEMTSLKELFLAPGKLDDLRPIAGLTQLESLRASITNVKDLKPLAGLTKLDRLDLGRTPVSDISPLANLTALTELALDETEVTDLAPLSKMKKLKVLNLKRTRVSDLGPLRELRELKNVYIEGSAIKDVSPIKDIPGLKIHEGR